jgi:dolichyl-phosphate-mannose--protein O-mannosyl transferase
VLLLAFFVSFFIYNYPFGCFWDENYHIASAQKYNEGVVFMEPHPPLGKMLIALGEVLFQPNTGIDTSSFVSTDYIQNFPPGYSFIGVRFIPALLFVFSSLLFFLILYRLSGELPSSFLFSFFYLFENALVVHNRSAMLEGPQLFFILLAVLFFLGLFQKVSQNRILDYFKLSVLIGLAISVKLNSAVLVFLLFFLIFKDYWEKIECLFFQKYEIKNRGLSFKDLAEMAGKAAVSIAGILLVFFLIYYLHFAIGRHVVKERFYSASEKYKEILNHGQTANPLYFFTMLSDNFRYTQNYEKGVPKWDSKKVGENGSPAYLWPFGYKSINYRWAKDYGNVSYYYLQGNPVVWYSVLIAVIASVVLVFGRLFFKIKPEGFVYILIFTLLYGAYMAAVLRIERVMYLYHYFIPLVFGMILFYLLFLAVFKELIEKKDKVLFAGVILLAIEVLAVFLFFSPFTYGIPISALDFARRMWLKIWDLSYICF